MEFEAFGDSVRKYLLFLVHIQQSAVLSSGDKAALFDAAKRISREVYANVQSYRSNLNAYNRCDKDRALSKAFETLAAAIERDFKRCKQMITLSREDFSFYDVVEKLTTPTYDVFLTQNEVRQLFSFEELSGHTEKEAAERKRLAAENEKLDKALAETREKAFLEMLHGDKNRNPRRFFQANSYILRACSEEERVYMHSQPAPTREGICLVEANGERRVQLRREGRLIEFSIRIIDANDSFLMYIQGSVRINDSHEEFYINERYPNSAFSTVLHSYNLKRLIDLFNESAKAEQSQPPEAGPNDIDDFFAGRIT